MKCQRGGGCYSRPEVAVMPLKQHYSNLCHSYGNYYPPFTSRISTCHFISTAVYKLFISSAVYKLCLSAQLYTNCVYQHSCIQTVFISSAVYKLCLSAQLYTNCAYQLSCIQTVFISTAVYKLCLSAQLYTNCVYQSKNHAVQRQNKVNLSRHLLSSS
jgi:hypothetical protein